MSYAIREALAAFRRAPLLTGLASAMVALALLVVGLFGLAAHNLRVALVEAEERVEIVAYLRDDARVSDVEALVATFESFPEVRSVTFVTKTQALETARRDLPEFEEIFSDLEVNPLPASLDLELAEGNRTSDSVDRLAELVGAYPEVEDVGYGREWVDKLFTLRQVAGVTAMVLGVAFAVVGALIIGTALRIAIFARREEIYVMRLVGAKDGFIRRPFLLEGAITGLVGAALALTLTYVAYVAVYRLLFSLEWIPALWIALGFGGGILLGVLASAVSVRRHLREV